MRRLLSTAFAALLLSGCSLDGKVFIADESIHITTPQGRTSVNLPLTLRWDDARSQAGPRRGPRDPGAEYYAVFFDSSPMAAGEKLSSLVDDRARCAQEAGCPTAAQLSDLGVYLTAEPNVAVDFLTDNRPTSRKGSKDPHEATVVRMLGDRRVGEAAFRVSFFVRR